MASRQDRRIDPGRSATINIELPFLEMGADSIVLIEAIRHIEAEYGVKLAMRRFFEDLATVQALAEYVADNLPVAAAPTGAEVVGASEAVAEPSTAAVAVAVAPSAQAAPLAAAAPVEWVAAEGGSTVERVLREQNQLLSHVMSQQMELLRTSLTGQAGVRPATAAAQAVASTASVAPRRRSRHRPPRPRSPRGNCRGARADNAPPSR